MMKKIYSLVLLALFSCVTAWAEEVEVSTINDLQTQLAAGHDVKLMADITITTTKAVSINSTVTLDLNGHSLIDAASNGSMFNFVDAASSSVTFTIKNGSITKTSTCYYPIQLNNLKNMSVVFEDVTIEEGSKYALLIHTKSKASADISVTVQGACAIPSIDFGGASDINLVNAASSTLNTSFKTIDNTYLYGIGRTIKLTNNGTLNLGAQTQITCKLTKTGTGACTVAPGAEFSENAWTNLELDDYCTSHSYVAETVIQPNSWTLAKKIFTSAPARKAQFGDNQYASVQVAMAVAYEAGGEQTVTLLADDEYETTALIMSDADITLDLNHHVLTVKQKIDFECAKTYHGKLTVRDGEITSSTSSDIFCNTNTTVTNEKPELILENVIVTNTYHNTDEYLSSRGKCFRTYGFFKLTLSGTTDCPVYLDLYKGISWANYFELTNNTQSKIYVMGYNSEYGRSNALSYYITDNTLLDKFGASNTNWEIWKGYIKTDKKDSYASHIKGAVNEEVLEIGPAGEEINAYWITEEGLPIVATVNGTNYYTLADALEASTSDHPAQLVGDLSAATINVRNGNNCYLDLNNYTLTLNSGVLTSQNSVENGQLHFVGTGIVNTSHPFNITGSTNASASNYSVLTIGENVTVNYSTLNNNYPYAIWVAANDSMAYGVGVDLAGTLNSNKSGAYINGNVQKSTGNVPVFNISGELAAKKLGIYAAGYGVWNITGAVDAATTDEEKSSGIAIKAGQLNINNGAVVSCKGDFERVAPYNNGVNIAGAALQIESNGSYAGAMQIAIADGAMLTCNGGSYAIYEYAENVQTAVNTIAIAEGTNSKFKGGILISQSLAARGGFVSGGKWTKDISANIKTGENLSLLNNPDGDNPPYLYLVGVPAPAQAKDYAEKDASNNAVLTNSASKTAAESYSSDNVGENPDVITIKETNPVVVSENTDVVATEAAPVVEVKKVTVDNNAQLTVTEGATLMVGAGSVLLDTTATTGGLTVEAGATLVVDGLIYGSTENNFVIESQEGKSGIVLFSPETEFIREDHPKATYRFTSKAFREGSKWVYQRFGVPTFDGHATIEWFNKPDGDEFKSWVKKWDYDHDEWTEWTAFSGNQLEINDVPPFQGLMLASNNVKPGNTNPAMIYEFTGSLMGNSDANLHFYYGWNYYANSYTAPININEFIQTVKTSLGGSNDILATIYLYQDMGDDTYTWQAVNEFTAGSSTVVGFAPGVGPIYENVPSVINPMQAFLMRLNVEGEANQTIDYADNVYTPATVNTFNPAPARNRVTNNSMQISVFNANGNFDKVFFVENDNFSNDLDNGFDAYKYDGNKGVSLYAMSADKHMEILASNDVDGSFIGINAPEAGNYTLYFSGVQGMNYALIDMKNNTVISVEEGGQYNFYAEAGQNDYRFQLVAPSRVPTAIENVGAKAELKGIYTITGQYLGEDINALPKGVYIINGAKVVK